MQITLLDRLEQLLANRFHGELKAGKHEANGECCALELLSAAREIPWTDSPFSVRCWDLRPLNDIAVSDDVRREYLLPVIAAYDGSMDWPLTRQQEVASRLAIGTVNRIVSALPILPPEVSAACATAADLWSAESAARSARAAAWSASAESAARWESVFRRACAVWMEAIQESDAVLAANAADWEVPE